MGRFRLSEVARRALDGRGEEAERWLAGLDETVDAFAAAWGFEVGATLDGGSCAFVADVTRRDGQPAVFKLALPQMRGTGEFVHELRALLANDGRNYVRVLAHDEASRALLLERLGPAIGTEGRSANDQIEVICATLRPWMAPPAALALPTGAAKARWLAEWISDMWVRLDRPCSATAVDEALEFAAEREAAYDAASAVLVHGDAHAGNLLRAPDGTYRFIDPDPMVGEPAIDLAVPMREWNDVLLAAGEVARGARLRCERMSELTDVDPRAIWQWGSMERLSTALLCRQLGFGQWADEAFAVADACARTPPPTG